MAKAKRKQRRGEPEGPSLEALAGALTSGTIGYIAIEAGLPGNYHPIHWLVTGVVGFAGYWIGEGIHRWKER